jgi:hypothetical protein
MLSFREIDPRFIVKHFENAIPSFMAKYALKMPKQHGSKGHLHEQNVVAKQPREKSETNVLFQWKSVL